MISGVDQVITELAALDVSFFKVPLKENTEVYYVFSRCNVI